MNRRFRPFYVAAVAVVMVGLFGTEVVPRSRQMAPPESASVPVTTASDDSSEWLGPSETPPPGLLNLTTSVPVLPFDVAH
jgi:hypothetical protein